ncbi:MAG TPA: class I SAM-dependent methyltransferase [Polyangiaceae bacterium]
MSAFDLQAATFDRRAGLLPEVRAAIAGAVLEIGAVEGKHRILDLGAGTGDIGLELLSRGASYRGVDVSSGMLAVFRQRAAAAGLVPDLVVADAGVRWPAEDGSVRVVFGSRSLHWIDTAHLASETARVALPEGAVLIIGRVVRAPDDPRERIRAAMREFLREHGYEGRSGGGRAREGIAECVRRGGRALPARVAATWTVARRPSASLADWRSKPGLAGRDVPEDVKASVLADVLRFTNETFGNIEAPVDVTERYVLDGVEMVFPGGTGGGTR